MENLNTKEFLESSKNNPVIDVRSPNEYSKGHIPGAINIPLFSNEERAIIGTLYKQKGREQAIQQGLDFVGPNMSSLVQQCSKLKFEDHLLIHCWRGGMRSESFAWLMKSGGIRCVVLSGGYKSYRKYMMQKFSDPLRLLILTGSTGSGKTEILRGLSSSGEQIIDLEELACHKGSVFGGLGQDKQPSTEQFQNYLFKNLSELDLTKRIWVEDESIGIGEVYIPHEFWEQMKSSPIIRIELGKAERINRLVHEYGLFPVSQLEEQIKKISKRLGGLETKNVLHQLQEGDLEATTRQLLRYYDKAYDHSIERKSPKLVCSLSYNNFDLDLITSNLLEEADKIIQTNMIYG